MLVMNQVYYSYETKQASRSVLRDASASFELGKVYAIYGASGAGKTTCLSLLGGLERPQGGSVELDGVSIEEIGGSALRKHSVAYVFQDYHLFPYLTALENVELAASIAKLPRDREKAVQLLERLGIDKETMNRPVTQTSGGQQQRTAIARALIRNPGYLLADEPTGNLDRENTAHIMELLCALAHEEGKCVIIATHSDAVRNRADVQLEMVDGALQWRDFA